jgi:glucosamine-6-phosphate deaminase
VNTFVDRNYDEMSSRAASLIADYVKRKPDGLLCFAAGNTPLGAYTLLVEAVRSGKVSFERCRFVSLDEWVGLSGEDEGSCRQTLDDRFFKPLRIDEANIHFFKGKSEDLGAECKSMDAFVSINGNIDLMVLGIGMNGHLGFNEPGASTSLYSHITDLAPVTQQVSVKYFSEKKDLQQGITLGIRHIMEADTVIVLADGAKKADIIKAAFGREVSDLVPASILQRHPNVSLLLDEAAAKHLN